MGDKPQLIFEVGTFGGILLMRFLISLLSNDLSIDVNPSLPKTLAVCVLSCNISSTTVE